MQGGDDNLLSMARARLRSKMREVDGCWIFAPQRAGGDYNKYRTMMVSYEVDGAHRWAYRAWVGPIPEGMQVNHNCDVAACFNPDHLYVGTQSQNISDCSRRGRHPRNKGGAKLTPEQVEYIRVSEKTAVALAAELGVIRHTVDSVRKGETWREET